MKILKLLLISTLLSTSISHAKETNIKVKDIQQIMLMDINSAITPATYNYLKTGFEKSGNVDLILIKMNTPGGLVTTTKDIINLFGESKAPVMIWVTPEGASATSAGAIIASGAHLLAMSEGTNIGAATPITMKGDIKQDDMKSKAVNDLVGLVTSLSETRGRNPVGFKKMVEEAASYSAQEAKKENYIDGILNKQSDLKNFINGRTVVMKGTRFKLETTNFSIVTHARDLGQQLLSIFSNPSFAYILLLLGAALIYLELQAPGGMIAGAIGSVALLLAAIGMQILPLNFGALGLIILSFVLFVLEAYITSYGVLSLAGLGSLIAGSLFLFRTENAYLQLPPSVIISAVAAITAFLSFVLFVMLKDQKNIGKVKFNSLVGKEGSVLEVLPSEEGHLYQVKISGEIWKATSNSELKEGELIKVTAQDNKSMILEIK